MYVNLPAQSLPRNCAQQELSFSMRSVDRHPAHAKAGGGGLVSENSSVFVSFRRHDKVHRLGQGDGGWGRGCLKQQSLSQSSGDLKFKIKVSAGLLPAEG